MLQFFLTKSVQTPQSVDSKKGLNVLSDLFSNLVTKDKDSIKKWFEGKLHDLPAFEDEGWRGVNLGMPHDVSDFNDKAPPKADVRPVKKLDMAKFSAFGSSSRNTSKQVSPTMSRATSKKMLEIKGGNDPSKKNISSVKNIVNPDSAKELDLVNNKDNGSKKNLSQRDTGVGLSKSDSVPQALKKDDSLAQGINNKAATPNLSQNQSAGNLNSTEPGSKTESTKS